MIRAGYDVIERPIGRELGEEEGQVRSLASMRAIASRI